MALIIAVQNGHRRRRGFHHQAAERLLVLRQGFVTDKFRTDVSARIHNVQQHRLRVLPVGASEVGPEGIALAKQTMTNAASLLKDLLASERVTPCLATRNTAGFQDEPES